jgi:hypothetical protein
VDGAWVDLFKKYSGYIKTDLVKDLNHEPVYLTLDYWKNKEVFYYLKHVSKTEFEEIDKKGDDLTIEEVHLGEFISG